MRGDRVVRGIPYISRQIQTPSALAGWPGQCRVAERLAFGRQAPPQVGTVPGTFSAECRSQPVRQRASSYDRGVPMLPRAASSGYDYVLIGRKGTPTRDFAALRKDLKTGLEKLGALRELNNDNDDAPFRAH